MVRTNKLNHPAKDNAVSDCTINNYNLYILRSRCSTLVKNLLQISLFLCKTNPISEKPKLTHTLFYKGLMKIFAPFGHKKTNPKRTQTKPNSERLKMNAIGGQKKQTQSNPISVRPKSIYPICFHLMLCLSISSISALFISQLLSGCFCRLIFTFINADDL